MERVAFGTSGAATAGSSTATLTRFRARNGAVTPYRTNNLSLSQPPARQPTPALSAKITPNCLPTIAALRPNVRPRSAGVHARKA